MVPSKDPAVRFGVNPGTNCIKAICSRPCIGRLSLKLYWKLVVDQKAKRRARPTSMDASLMEDQATAVFSSEQSARSTTGAGNSRKLITE
jgi:hypothetical protein